MYNRALQNISRMAVGLFTRHVSRVVEKAFRTVTNSLKCYHKLKNGQHLSISEDP